MPSIEGRNPRQKGFKDVFPGVEPDRVKNLMEEPDFQKSSGLGGLGIELDKLAHQGHDVGPAIKLWEEHCAPDIERLNRKLSMQGWEQDEITAAHVVKRGAYELPGDSS